MRYSNELKVGLAIVLAGIIFFLGLRYFQDLPLFSGSYALETRFESSGGLAAGNAVRINGVRVGSVESVALDPQTKSVQVDFRVDDGVDIPQGSYAKVEGLGALGEVRLAVVPGPPENPPLEPGSHLPGRSTPGVIGQLTDEAPQLIGRADSVLTTAGTALGEAGTLLSDPDSDLRQTLAALRSTARTLDRLLRAQQEHLTRTLENTEALTADLSRFTGESADSLNLTVEEVNRALRRLNTNLATLETTTDRLGAITAKIDRGEGTLGRLVNDESLYAKLDSAATQLNTLLTDLQQNPERYLRELKLVDLF